MNPAFQAITAWPYNAVQRLHVSNGRRPWDSLNDPLPPRTCYSWKPRLDLGPFNWVAYSTFYGAYSA